LAIASGGVRRREQGEIPCLQGFCREFSRVSAETVDFRVEKTMDSKALHENSLRGGAGNFLSRAGNFGPNPSDAPPAAETGILVRAEQGRQQGKNSRITANQRPRARHYGGKWRRRLTLAPMRRPQSANAS
jgi:hypothetical protein